MAVVDCGIAINPALARIQAEGGIVQGIGHTLFENITYYETGKPVESNFMQYKIPTRSYRDTYRLSLRIATSRQVHLAQNPSEKS